MKRSLVCLVLAALVAGACGSDDDGSTPSDGAAPGEGNGNGGAASPFSPAPPEGAERIAVEPGSYNYSPAVIDEGDVIKAWWCSAVPDAATDNIWYQEYDKKTKKTSKRQSVLQTGNTGDWDTFGVCHPSVIRGAWPGRAGGQEATYAMYYTSTNVAQGGGSNNSTGVVFSADGIKWFGQHDRYNPMIKQKVPNVPGTYGAGLPSAWSRGGSAVTLFWIDTTSVRTNNPASPDGYQSKAVLAHSEDGIRFGPRTLLSDLGGAPVYWKNDFAFDDSVTPAMVYSAQALNFRVGKGKEDKNETYNFGFYRIPMDEFLAGRGTWEQLGVIDANLTGLPLNFEPGIARTGEGKVPPDVQKEGLRVWFGGGGQTPRTWQLRSMIFHLRGGQLPLRQYTKSSGSAKEYWATTGFVPESFRDGGDPETLGLLDVKPSPGVVPLYGCQRGPLTINQDGELTGEDADRFVSLERCSDDQILGINGYLFPQPPAGTQTKPIYACKDGRAQFVSNDPKCEGKAVEKLLGHARAG